MKQFEKWLKEDSIKSGYLYDEEAERQREKGWRAALEMVQRWYMEVREGRPQTFDLGLWDMLKKELEEIEN